MLVWVWAEKFVRQDKGGCTVLRFGFVHQHLAQRQNHALGDELSAAS